MRLPSRPPKPTSEPDLARATHEIARRDGATKGERKAGRLIHASQNNYTVAAKTGVMHDKEFLLFQDHLRNPDPHGWVAIARMTSQDERNRGYVFSALASPASVDVLLKTPEHEVRSMDQGIHTFPEPNNSHEDIQIYLEPFVAQAVDKVYHNKYEFVRGFIRHHGLSLDQGKYAYVDPDGKEIARTMYSCMQVREDSLLDYLAARKKVLVIYYDHDRRLNVDVAKLFGTERINETLEREDAKYERSIINFEGGAYSRLVGKRIVRPSPTPSDRAG